jgi:hypothetical protein
VSDSGATSSGKGVKISMAIRSRITRESTLSAPKYSQQWGDNHFILYSHSLRSPVFLFHSYSPPAEFTWNKKFHLPWVPQELTPDLRRCRQRKICGRLLPILEARHSIQLGCRSEETRAG